jgi:Phosphoribosyltransferase
VGAGPLRVARGHPPRPPIPIRPLDADAMQAARARPGASALAVWLAGCAGHPVADLLERVVEVAGGPAGTSLTVAEVAAAVDEGREHAARAAADGVTVVAGAAEGDGARAGAAALAAWLTGRSDVATERGPLGALRRLGGHEVAVLCGLALGAGEHGLGCVCEGLPATAGAALAVAVEPDVRPRLLAGAPPADDALHAALLDHLGLEPVAGPLAALRRACADTR